MQNETIPAHSARPARPAPLLIPLPGHDQPRYPSVYWQHDAGMADDDAGPGAARFCFLASRIVPLAEWKLEQYNGLGHSFPSPLYTPPNIADDDAGPAWAIDPEDSTLVYTDDPDRAIAALSALIALHAENPLGTPRPFLLIRSACVWYAIHDALHALAGEPFRSDAYDRTVYGEPGGLYIEAQTDRDTCTVLGDFWAMHGQERAGATWGECWGAVSTIPGAYMGRWGARSKRDRGAVEAESASVLASFAMLGAAKQYGTPDELWAPAIGEAARRYLLRPEDGPEEPAENAMIECGGAWAVLVRAAREGRPEDAAARVADLLADALQYVDPSTDAGVDPEAAALVAALAAERFLIEAIEARAAELDEAEDADEE